MRSHRLVQRFGVKHVHFSKQILSLLLLTHKDPFARVSNLQTKEITQGSQILHAELSIKALLEISQNTFIANCENYIINIDENS